ncbi:MAG TPA: pitrilysin family protein [Verrucomicrobiae bacterium]|nr:pitrilysin family protein [Verrucomicrobiae bacterium]
MKHKLSVALFFTVLMLTAGEGRAGTQLNADKDVLRATLKNGLRVVIVRDPIAPVVTTVVNYQVGSDEAPAGFPGMAHALEHMMFRGNPGLSADQLAQISAAMGGNFDADTQQTITQYYFTVPADDLELALHTESLRMSGILATDELWGKERGAIEQEVAQDLSNPEYVLYEKLLAAMFKGSPYEHDALGTRPSFDKTTGAMLKDFYGRWYAPNNAILIVVGDVEPQSTLASIDRLFGKIPAKKLPRRPAIELQSVRPDSLHLTSDLAYGLAVITFRVPGSDSADYAALQVLGDVLGSHRADLYALVPAGKALSTDFSVDTLPKAGLAYATATFPKDSNGAILIKELQDVIRHYIKSGVPADLVEASKRHRLAGKEFERNSIEGLAMSWAEALAGEGRHSPDDDVEAIKKVTVADVNRVARKHLNLDRTITAIVTPEESGKPVSSSSYGGHESFASSEKGNVPLPDWAAAQLAKLPVPTSSLNPVVTTLTNGLQLIVQPETMSGTVSLSGKVRNNPNLEAAPGREGVDQVMDQLFEFGSESLDRVAFQKALDDIGATESAGTEFSLNVLTNYFDRGVQLLADNLLRPAFPGKAFTTVRREVSDTVAGELQTPEYLAHRALAMALLPKDDPALRQATTSTVSALTLGDVRDYYRHVFRPDLTTIVVVGNVTPENARSVVEKWFGDWTASGPKPEVLPAPVPTNGPAVTAVPDKSRVQDQVTLAEMLGLNRSNPDFYALRLGNFVLGGGFYATRLYRDLRKENGLVYSVESSFDIHETRGMYQVEYGCDPPNVSKAREMIVRDLTEMQTRPVGADELQQAKAEWLRGIPLSESSTGDIATKLLYYSTHDLPLDETIHAAKLCLALTAEDVQAAFAKWVHPENLVQESLGPEPK